MEIYDIYYYLAYFYIYGVMGWCLEVAFAAVRQRAFVNRGFLNGPICPIYGVGMTIVILLLELFEENIVLLYISSAVLVTVIEGVTGFVLDKLFHCKWWDYSNMPLNIGGYVCLLFSLIWGVACIVIVKLIHPLVEKFVSIIPQNIGLIITIILTILLFVDLCVTVQTILKLNKRLARMKKIAADLRELSEQMGKNISEGVIDIMEKNAENQKRFEQFTENSRTQIEAAAESQRKRTEESIGRIEGKLEESKQRKEAMLEESRQYIDAKFEESKRHKERREAMLEESRQFVQEQTEESRQRVEDKINELKSRQNELRSRYTELEADDSRLSKRLMKAFPNMKSTRHAESLEKLKNKDLDNKSESE